MRLVHSLAILSFIALGSAVSGGCAENRSTMFIENVLGQDPTSTECDTTPPGTRFYASGTYDTGAPRDYIAQLVVANQMTPLGNNTTLRAETSRIQVEGAIINIPNGPFKVQLAATINPVASSNPGFVSLPVNLLPQGTPPDDYDVGITIFGTTLGGQKVETAEFHFPITVYESGTLAYCGSLTELTEAGAFAEPCGRGGQDNYLYACKSESSSTPGCSVCK